MTLCLAFHKPCAGTRCGVHGFSWVLHLVQAAPGQRVPNCMLLVLWWSNKHKGVFCPFPWVPRMGSKRMHSGPQVGVFLGLPLKLLINPQDQRVLSRFRGPFPKLGSGRGLPSFIPIAQCWCLGVRAVRSSVYPTTLVQAIPSQFVLACFCGSCNEPRCTGNAEYARCVLIRGASRLHI